VSLQRSSRSPELYLEPTSKGSGGEGKGGEEKAEGREGVRPFP